MSDMKLYKPRYPGNLSQEKMPTYHEATTSEIMDAHPKCGECGSYETERSRCYNTSGLSCTVNPNENYCSEWWSRKDAK